MKQQTIVISLGGSLIVPDGIDTAFLTRFKKIITNYAKKNKVIIICGGGNTSRIYQKHLRIMNNRVDRKTLDILGVAITKINALLLHGILDRHAESRLLADPTKKITIKKNIIIGHGWRWGYSSDKVAVMAAKTFGVQAVVNLSNIMYVYNKDPKKFKNAKYFKAMTWSQLRKIVGNKWNPGAHVPFDPVAARLAQKWKQRLIVMKGSDLKNFENFLHGKKFSGTTVEY